MTTPKTIKEGEGIFILPHEGCRGSHGIKYEIIAPSEKVNEIIVSHAIICFACGKDGMLQDFRAKE